MLAVFVIVIDVIIIYLYILPIICILRRDFKVDPLKMIYFCILWWLFVFKNPLSLSID